MIVNVHICKEFKINKKYYINKFEISFKSAYNIIDKCNRNLIRFVKFIELYFSERFKRKGQKL